MIAKNPIYGVEVVALVSAGGITHAVVRCPRCGVNIGINEGMRAGIESIICKGRSPNGRLCNGHYYLRGDKLEFLGTVGESS